MPSVSPSPSFYMRLEAAQSSDKKGKNKIQKQGAGQNPALHRHVSGRLLLHHPNMGSTEQGKHH